MKARMYAEKRPGSGQEQARTAFFPPASSLGAGRAARVSGHQQQNILCYLHVVLNRNLHDSVSPENLILICFPKRQRLEVLTLQIHEALDMEGKQLGTHFLESHTS